MQEFSTDSLPRPPALGCFLKIARHFLFCRIRRAFPGFSSPVPHPQISSPFFFFPVRGKPPFSLSQGDNFFWTEPSFLRAVFFDKIQLAPGLTGSVGEIFLRPHHRTGFLFSHTVTAFPSDRFLCPFPKHRAMLFDTLFFSS